MTRRFGEPVRTGIRYRARPGVYAIVLAGDALLVTHQTDPEPEFQLPGGGVDPGEQPLRALHREVFEETGWTVATPRKLGSYRRFTFMPDYDLWAEKVCHVYVARAARRIGPPTEPHHAAVMMAPEVAVEALGSAGDRDFVRRFLR